MKTSVLRIRRLTNELGHALLQRSDAVVERRLLGGRAQQRRLLDRGQRIELAFAERSDGVVERLELGLEHLQLLLSGLEFLA